MVPSSDKDAELSSPKRKRADTEELDDARPPKRIAPTIPATSTPDLPQKPSNIKLEASDDDPKLNELPSSEIATSGSSTSSVKRRREDDDEDDKRCVKRPAIDDLEAGQAHVCGGLRSYLNKSRLLFTSLPISDV